MHTTLLRTVTFSLAVLLLVACTRDRETPTPTPEPSPAATQTSGQAANQSGSVTTTVRSSDEPVVESTTGTPTPKATEEATPTPDAAVAETFDYTVKPGETLAGIADKFQTEVQTLRELNFLLDDNIFAGQVLSVPYVEGMTAEGAPTPSPTPFTYVVEVGDTLSSIAARYNVKPGTLIEVNNILDPNNLAVGTPLLIPGYVSPAGANDSSATSGAGDTQTDTAGTGDTTAAGSTAGEAVVHIVQPGESLGQIAAEYGIDPVALADANNITNGNLIRVGQSLVIPGVTARQALEARGERHIVQSGESLSMIAAQYGVSVEAIMAANSLDDPNTIVVGQELLIPPSQ
ncbi:MAG: LysM peptidoglycan-binding domain-containing protein [Caldilineaceae bacterium]